MRTKLHKGKAGWTVLILIILCTAVTEAQNFKKADSVAALYQGYSLYDLPELTKRLTSSFHTEGEKFRSIYRWICNNVEYDYQLYLLNKRKREKIKSEAELQQWNDRIGPLVFQTLVKKRRTVCTGYAYLLKEMATHAGLQCEVVDGYGRNGVVDDRMSKWPDHSWNRVMLQGKWHWCDVTWSSGGMNLRTGEYVRKFNDRYFLEQHETFLERHVEARKKS